MRYVVLFNSYDYGSTGSLCSSLKNNARNDTSFVFVVGEKAKSNSGDYYLYNHSNKLFRFLIFRARKYFGHRYLGLSNYYTSKVIAYLKKRISFRKDKVVFNLHNVQFMCFNIFSLISFAKKHNIKIVWTLHDCWPFTGGCNYFTNSNCVEWSCNHECKKCVQKIKNSRSELCAKDKIYQELFDLITVVSPSRWINGIVKQSIMAKCSHCVINNGIDTTFWSLKKTIHRDSFRIISVASPWDERKGLRYINELASLLPEKYILTVVGLSKDCVTDPRIQRFGILSKTELRDLYGQSDIFLNPTLEDNFPTVNIEALLCGLPIVSFDTGGSGEIFDESTGVLVEEKNADALLKAVMSINPSAELSQACRNRGLIYSKENFCESYYKLFDDVSKLT